MKKKCFLLMLIIPFILNASDLKFLAEDYESEDYIKTLMQETPFAYEWDAATAEEQSLLPLEKKPAEKPLFPWTDEGVLDEEISLSKDQKIQNNAQNRHLVKESSSEFYPTFEEVPSRTNQFWQISSQALTSAPEKPGPQKPYVQEVSQNNNAKPQLKKNQVNPSNSKGVQKKTVRTQEKRKGIAVRKKLNTVKNHQTKPRAKKGMQVEVAQKNDRSSIKKNEKTLVTKTEPKKKSHSHVPLSKASARNKPKSDSGKNQEVSKK